MAFVFVFGCLGVIFFFEERIRKNKDCSCLPFLSLPYRFDALALISAYYEVGFNVLFNCALFVLMVLPLGLTKRYFFRNEINAQ